jgi:hypothetical protein
MKNKISPDLGHSQHEGNASHNGSLPVSNTAQPLFGSPSPTSSEADARRIPPNNNGNSLPITQHIGAKQQPQPLQFGTYDTLQMTSQAYRETDLRSLETWTRVAVGSSQPHQYRKVLYLDREGREVKAGDHVTTVGLAYHADHAATVVTVPSLPALVHGAGLKVLRPQDVEPAMDRVRNAVAPYLDADLDGFKIGRLDSSTTFPVKEPTAAYIGLLHAMTSPRVHRMDKKLYHGETVQFFNTLRSVGFYDKGLKEYPDGMDQITEATAQEYLRFEVQEKQARSVASTYGKIHFADLKAEAQMAKAVQHRVGQFEKFFKFDADGAAIFEDQYNLMKAQRDAPGRNGVLQFLALMELKDGTTVDEVLHLMAMVGYNRSHIHRTGKKLALMASKWSHTTDMYEEVKGLIYSDLKAVA